MRSYSEITSDGFLLAGGIESGSRSGIYRRFIKRILDVTVASAALVVCSPLLLLAALLVMLESRGPVLFKQQRLGAGGRVFTIYKIRTMVPGSEHEGVRTREDDPRVTRLGKILRDWKFDELPQLWNVIRGDMSLIGPRPLSVAECEVIASEFGYQEEHPGFKPTVRPGLTGPEQISRNGNQTYAQRFAINHDYERGLSFWLDCRTLLATIGVCRVLTALVGITSLVELLTLVDVLRFGS